jgi:heterotetrameric sarcosine oxidase gamma subunit
MLERSSAIAGHPARFAEAAGETLIQAAGFRNTTKAFAAALGGLPEPGVAEARGGATWFRTGPEQAWILNGPAPTLPADIGAVTDLTGSRTRFLVDDPGALDILAQGIPLDLHPSIFAAGRFVQTGLHHTPVLLWHRSAVVYELWALRTFAVTVREWLEDAARSSFG